MTDNCCDTIVVEDLIVECVKRKPCLYQKNNEKYKITTSEKLEEFEAIAVEINKKKKLKSFTGNMILLKYIIFTFIYKFPL